MIHESFKEKIKDAMKARDSVRLGVMRALSADMVNELVAKKRAPDAMLNDEEALEVIRRSSKKRADSIAQFRAAGRQDLVDSEEAELKYVTELLPTLMSKEEILPIAKAKKAELNITDKSKLGQFIGALMKDLKGKADGADVKAIAEGLFE